MAISHVQRLLLLLASLFFLPALYAHKFQYCNNNAGYDFGKVTGVATTPTKGDDTTNTIYVSVNATQGLNGGIVTVNLRMSEGGHTMDGLLYPLSKVVDAVPIKPATSFVLTLTEVPFETEIVRYHSVTVTLNGKEYTGEFVAVLCINFNPWSDTELTAVSA